MKKSLIVTILAITIYTPSVIAFYYDDDWYLNLTAGYVFGSQNTSTSGNSDSIFFSPIEVEPPSSFQLQDVTWRNNFNGGGEGNFALGAYFYSNWRIDFEFLYQNMERNIEGSYNWIELITAGTDTFAPQLNNSFADSASQLHVYNFFMNLYYDFNNASKWTPFLGAGIGAAIVNSDSTTTNGTLTLLDETAGVTEIVPVSATTPSLKGTPFVWQLKGGIAYAVNSNLSILGQYRLSGSSELSAGSTKITLNPNTAAATTFYTQGKSVHGLLNNGFDLGFQYDFNVK